MHGNHLAPCTEWKPPLTFLRSSSSLLCFCNHDSRIDKSELIIRAVSALYREPLPDHDPFVNRSIEDPRPT